MEKISVALVICEEEYKNFNKVFNKDFNKVGEEVVRKIIATKNASKLENILGVENILVVNKK